MITKMHQIEVAGFTIDVIRKDIKNLHLAVYPPTGRLRVAAPLHLDDEAIRLHIISKLGWIKKHIKQFQNQERLSKQEFVSGESHYLRGQRYLLKVIPHSHINRVHLRNKTYIDLYVKSDTSFEHRKQLMIEWYRARLKVDVALLINKWQSIIGVQLNSWQIKRMKTKWGSCNVKAKRIWINLELAKKPVSCLEYIVVHELVHLLERLHNDNFRAYMDRFLPDWRKRKEELNRFPLSHEEWEY